MRRISALLPVLFCAVRTLAQDKTALVVEQDQSAPVNVVYHIDDAAAQALNAPRNMRNQMDVAPKTKIVVATHGDGVDFLFDGARSQTLNRIWGVDFRAQGSGRLVRGLPDHDEAPPRIAFRHGYNDRRAGVVSTGPSLIDRYSWVQAALTAFSLEMPSILSAAVS